MSDTGSHDDSVADVHAHSHAHEPRARSMLTRLTNERSENDLVATTPAAAASPSSPPPSPASPPLLLSPAHVPVHKVFDAPTFVDPQWLVHVLHVWIGPDDDHDVRRPRAGAADAPNAADDASAAADDAAAYTVTYPDEADDPALGFLSRRTPDAARTCDRTAIALALVDARFYTSLYHHYRVRRTVHGLPRVWWKRRMHVHEHEHEQHQQQQLSWFVPRFTIVAARASRWRKLLATLPWLLERIEDKRLLHAPGQRVRKPLPVTSFASCSDRFSHADGTAAELAASLPHLTCLTSFHMHGCAFDTASFDLFASSLRHMPRLSTLRMRGCFMPAQSWDALATALPHLPHLTTLILVGSGIGAEGCCALARSLGRLRSDDGSDPSDHRRLSPSPLTTLHLGANRIGEVGCRGLASAFPRLPHLTSLNLSWCEISGRDTDPDLCCWAQFAAGLHHLPQLTALNLRHNYIGARSARLIADALLRLPRVAIVDWVRLRHKDDDRPVTSLRSGWFSAQLGFCAFALSLQRVPQLAASHLTSLDVCGLYTHGLVLLAASLQHVPQLTRLRVQASESRSGIVAAGANGRRGRDDDDDRDIVLDTWQSFAASLRHVPRLVDLGARWFNPVRRTDCARAVFEAIREHLPRIAVVNGVATARVVGEQVTRVSFWGKAIEDVGGLFLASRLPHAPHLTELNLSGCKVHAAGGIALAASLQDVPELTLLDVAGNYLTDGAAWALFASLRHVPRLTSLNVRANHVGVNGSRALANAALSLPALATLDLSANPAEVDGFLAIAEWLPHARALTSLNVGWCHVDMEGCCALLAALERMRGDGALESLVISGNDVFDEGCLALAAALQHVPRLTMLGLENCSIGDTGCLALAAALVHVSHLRTLVLSGSTFGDASCVSLVAALAQHQPHLSTLRMWHCYRVGDDGRRALQSLSDRVAVFGCGVGKD